MKRMILLVAMFVLAVGTAFAHGNDQHIMGKVIGMTDSSITVQTKAKDSVTVFTMAETKFEKSGTAASMKDLKVGDRVLIEETRPLSKDKRWRIRQVIARVNG